MLRDHYKIETDVARVYKVRARGPRRHWGWAIATIREWRQGGQIDIQSDFGNYAYAWGSIGNRPLRQFLTELEFDYFMKKAATRYRVLDAEASVRAIKGRIFERAKDGAIDRATAHEWRDELDDLDLPSDNLDLFANRLLELDWFWKVFYDYPEAEIVMRDCPQARAFWEGPWQALCAHWKAEIAAQRVEA